MDLTIPIALAAELPAASPQAAANPAAPATIPCVPSLPCIQTETQQSGASIRTYIFETFGGGFLSGFLGLVAIASVIFIIVGGVQMHLAMGNDDEVGKARKTITWAIGGLIISLLSVALVQIISKLFA